MRRRVTVALSRLTRILLLVAVALCLGAPTAGAVPVKKQDNNLAAMWTTILQTLKPQNRFLTDGCISLGGTLAPFGGPSTGAGPCTVKPGTKIFVAAASAECSTFPGDTPPPPPPWTEKQLGDCARNGDVKVAPTVEVDKKPVLVTEVVTPLLNIDLPADNIFGPPLLPAQVPAGKGQSVAHGWVTLLHPLTPGEHTIVGTGPVNFTTTIVVQPGFKP
jgi:hypothetical protein